MFLSKTSRIWNWKSFFKNEVKGSIAIEGAFLLPIFALIFLASTTIFQVQRVGASYLHAATTLSDLVTRQIEITDDNVDNFYATAQSLVTSNGDLTITFTSVSYNATDDEYFVNWSSSNVSGEEHENDDIESFRFPAMEADIESVMLVVIKGSYTPIIEGLFDAGIEFYEHAIRRPRFVRLVDRKP